MKGSVKVHYGEIYIPHLNYWVAVKKFKGAPPEAPYAMAYTERTGKNSCTIWLAPYEMPGLISHELTHVLQYICGRRGIDFVHEMEHMGYLMQFLFMKIQGAVWSSGK